MVNAQLVAQQFGELLASVELPDAWREAIAARCAGGNGDISDAERARKRRAELEVEQQRLVTAFTKGYLAETDLDAKKGALRAELQRLPPVESDRDVEAQVAAAVSAGETLADMASYWEAATSEERRDIVWALTSIEGVVYDLERRMIAGILPRPDVLPVLALGLEGQWVRRDDGGLWRMGLAQLPKPERIKNVPPPTPPALTPEQQVEALRLVHLGLSLRKVAGHFPGVSYGAIWRLVRLNESKNLSSNDVRE